MRSVYLLDLLILLPSWIRGFVNYHSKLVTTPNLPKLVLLYHVILCYQQ